MAYATDAQLRAITHFSTSEISVSDVTTLVPLADNALMRLATILATDERLSGGIDGVNTIFTTAHKNIADTDFDSDVDGDDVTVYLVDYDSENNPVHTATTVTTVNARDGIITLATAPTTIDAEVGVYADYRYYMEPIDYVSLKLAASYYLAHLAELKVQGKMEQAYIMEDKTIRSKYPGKEPTTRWLSVVYQILGTTSAAPRLRVSK